LNDFITALTIPGTYMDRMGGSWYIYLHQQAIYKLEVVQEQETLWLAYEQAERLKLSAIAGKKYIRENS